ncbi:hypothetical protein OG607_01415 [Streptomyces sp. NBC_01537]|uniref:hypothetical protein n=1 Tax=Streptomyces sp. NBC_01537 TaxID=2903896 RepID=UPI003870753A
MSGRSCRGQGLQQRPVPPVPAQPGIRRTIPEKADSQAARRRKGSRGGRPPGFDEERHEKRNKLKQARAVVTRYDKRRYVYLGTATVAALIIWLRT